MWTILFLIKRMVVNTICQTRDIISFLFYMEYACKTRSYGPNFFSISVRYSVPTTLMWSTTQSFEPIERNLDTWTLKQVHRRHYWKGEYISSNTKPLPRATIFHLEPSEEAYSQRTLIAILTCTKILQAYRITGWQACGLIELKLALFELYSHFLSCIEKPSRV